MSDDQRVTWQERSLVDILAIPVEWIRAGFPAELKTLIASAAEYQGRDERLVWKDLFVKGTVVIEMAPLKLYLHGVVKKTNE